MIKITLFFSIFWFFPIVYAYEPQNHTKLTKLAAYTFNLCSSKKITPKEISLLQKYNAGEDNFISKLPQRLKNWHFYASKKNINPTTKHPLGFTINRSMNRLVDQINQEINKQTHFNAKIVGSALHFIEDTTVPAHVLPIYHGPLIIGMKSMTNHPQALLKNYKWSIKDKIDEWPIDEDKILAIVDELTLEKDFCFKLLDNQAFALVNYFGQQQVKFEQFSKKPNLIDIIEITAQTTLTSLTELIPGTKETWQWYWINQENQFFSTYKTDASGKIIVFGDKVNGQKIDKNQLNDFVLRGHLQAILSGTQMISLAKD